MTLTEDPQKLLELRQFYLTQVDQLYQQIQKWGTGKMEFAFTDNCPIYDKTGNEDYHAPMLTAEIIKKNADGLEGIVHFFPRGLTFLTEEGVIQLYGPFSKEELIYMQKDKLTYTERNGQIVPRDEGFETDGWYWMFTRLGKTKMRPLTEKVFRELVCRSSGYSREEVS